MRLRGPWLINRSRLDTSTSSQGGTILANTAVVISMNPYSFFPDREGRMTALWDLSPMFGITPAADADAPQFLFFNNDPSDRPYDTAWRHVNA